MIKLTVIHYYPIEYYPPVINFLNTVASVESKIHTHVYTTHNKKNRKVYDLEKIEIKRYDAPEPKQTVLKKSILYAVYFLKTLYGLIKTRPHAIFYYESISSWPVYVYSRLVNRKCKIFIHYHEYASSEWYENYMKIVKYFHKLEKRQLYPHADWISQTNSNRLDLFSKDHPGVSPNKLQILPNYPPKNWQRQNENKTEFQRKKIVYIGSLAFESTYIRELCDWIVSQEKYSLDIYSYNLHNDVKQYFKQLKSEKVTFHEGGIEYEEVPNILSNYGIGVILHKAFNENYKYNATNKLFEYLACNLNIWFPEELEGCWEYITEETIPQVTKVDFLNISSTELNSLSEKNLPYQAKQYWFEDAYSTILEKIQ
ncbi:hypothetical protein ACNI3T_09175 [Christiangramia sp. ASW11-125]|uniref:hypothetical protein n=1 Tax=Christiangramia sp. ASW11-125 TaxID=3400701 RepID=UPI003AAA97CF